jgi:hypothetical protein
MENNNLNSLPFLLQKLCDEKGKNVRQVALSAGIGESTLYRFAQGQSGLQNHTAKALNHYFETDAFQQCIYRDGNLIASTSKPKKCTAANLYNVGDVVKNLHDKMIKSIIKVKFDKEKQSWMYLLAGEQDYVEEQHLKSVKVHKINSPQPEPQPKTIFTEIIERAAEKLEEVPVSEPELEKPKEETPILEPEPILESKETQEPEPEVKIVPVNNHSRATPVEDKLKKVILSIVEQLLCLL